jgi:hypothetical protein
MDSNHEETSSLRISKLLILRSTTSHESHVIDCIRTAFVHKWIPSRMRKNDINHVTAEIF